MYIYFSNDMYTDICRVCRKHLYVYLNNKKNANT